MPKKEDTAYFVTFCIEQYKNKHKQSGSEVMTLFMEYGVIDYLIGNFEILHTQGMEWILEDIEEFMQIRKDK